MKIYVLSPMVIFTAVLIVVSSNRLAYADEPAPPNWLLGHAYKIPSQYTNQESGYPRSFDPANR